MQIEPGAWPSWCSDRVGDVLVPLVRAQLVQFVVAQRRGRAGARQPRQPSPQWRAGASRGQSSAARRIYSPALPLLCWIFFDGLGQWACQEAAGREKLVKTPAPAQEVGVSRRRPLARAPCLRGSEFFFFSTTRSVNGTSHTDTLRYHDIMETMRCHNACRGTVIRLLVLLQLVY